ncbi:hypothetical protein FRC12_017323 [Ceratobasidium sp. 428]|nr:hypothetical protein FRC12_017323 [Ceratobasidium sp. 428]
MTSRRTLSEAEKELVEIITTLTENVGQNALTRQLRELMLLINSPDHDTADLLACSEKVLEHLNDSGARKSDSKSLDDLVKRLNAVRQIWAISPSQRNMNQKRPLNVTGHTSKDLVDAAGPTTASDGPNGSDSNVTQIRYSMSADTYRLLQDAQFLYRLSNMPETALPPDQSILSIMRSYSLKTESSQPSGHSSIEESAKRAYWDQMKEALSHHDPKEHIDQLKALYKDLSEATSRFFPHAHTLYAMFKCPLAPTTQPLETATINMRLLAAGLRERCAPVRDNALKDVQKTLINSSAASIVNAAQSIVEVARLMREDLNSYVLQNASEEDARQWVRSQARAKEREIALKISGTQEKLAETWNEYMRLQTTKVSWTSLARRLLETVSSPTAAIFLPLEVRTDTFPNQNIVPPQLMLSIDSLVRVQDLIQAVVIVASLRSLVPVSPDLAESFASRIWALVDLVIMGRGSVSEPQLKLINLQDEVIEAYRKSYMTHASPHTAISEETLRATVSRTLRAEDPVFRLLQKRLVSALEAEIVQPAFVRGIAPIVMRTGKDRDVRNPSMATQRASIPRIRAKGFDDHTLDEPMIQLLDCFRRVLGWMMYCWDDFVSVE